MAKILLYVIIALVLIIGISFIAEAFRTKKFGWLIFGLIALASAITAFIFHSWWPLLIGFLLNAVSYSVTRG